MRKSPKLSLEVVELAVRMVFDAKDQYPSQWAAIKSIAGKIGCTAERRRVKKRVRDTEAHTHQRQRLCRQRERQAGQAKRQYQRAAKDRGVLPTRMQWANGDGKHGPRHGADGPEVACHGRGQTTVDLQDSAPPGNLLPGPERRARP